MQTEEITNSIIFNFDKWEAQLPGLKESYHAADPYPHIMLENFMEPDAARPLMVPHTYSKIVLHHRKLRTPFLRLPVSYY